MSEPNAFSERGQEAYPDIPTDPAAFLQWASRQPREAGRFELSNGKVVRTVINKLEADIGADKACRTRHSPDPC